MTPRDSDETGQPAPPGPDGMSAAAAGWRALPDLCFLMDAENRFAEISRPDHMSLATPWPALCGRTLADVAPAAVVRRTLAALALARTHGQAQSTEYTLRLQGSIACIFEARIVAMAAGRWLIVTRDVTAAVSAQRALRESEARYARAVRGTSDGLWDWEIATGRDYLSPRWKELLGFADHELADAEGSFFDRIHPDDVGAVRAAVHAHFQHGAPFDIELRLRTKPGTYRWFRSRGEVERDADGRPRRMAGSIADVTARKQIEEALRDSQARFSAMFHTAPVGIALATLDDGQVLEVNEALAQMLGWAVGEMVGRSAPEVGLWVDGSQRATTVAQVREHGRAALQDLQMRHRTGRVLHAKVSLQGIELGGRSLLLSAVTDITDRVQAEQALHEQREAYRAIFNAASDAIVSIDEQLRVVLFNPGAERIFQRSAVSVQGQPIDGLLLPAGVDGQPGPITLFASVLHGNEALGAGRIQGLRADGEQLELEASISRAAVAGRLVLTAILRDVTDRVRAEAEGLRLQVELSALTRQLMAQEQHTTQRLAQALHDQVGQTLTALRITLDRARRAPDALPADAALRRAQADELVAQAIQQVRRVLIDLRPPLLEDEGLYAALDNEVTARATLHSHTDVLLDAPAALQLQRWPAEVEYALFMIAREAIDNALRHADATLVSVAIGGGAAEVCVEVADNGVGMAPGADRARPGHLGLIGMRERALAIGARLGIEASADGGTCLRATWAAAA